MGTKGTVVVGMSGGVDSSVSAFLLQKEGYNVIGITMQIWQTSENNDKDDDCCSLSAVNDARRVADLLNIPFYVMNFRELFEKEVIDYFTAEYMKGRTPNPCIVCNKKIKFSGFLKKAKALRADYIATGHYAKIEYNSDNNRYILKKAVDEAKDQTYVLYNLTQEQMEHTLFPLGRYTKPEIRSIASEIGLKVADKPESQEICFIEDNNYKRFIEERVGADKFIPGSFRDTKGKIIGTHEGIARYTIGQRKGLGLALGYPAYVVNLNPKKNEVIIGKNEEVFQKNLLAENNNYIAIEKLDKKMEVDVKIRYSAKPAKALIEPFENNQILVKFNEPQRAITPGQAVVYYNQDIVIGGGTIVKGF